jgi:hypothetical protein
VTDDYARPRLVDALSLRILELGCAWFGSAVGATAAAVSIRASGSEINALCLLIFCLVVTVGCLAGAGAGRRLHTRLKRFVLH